MRRRRFSSYAFSLYLAVHRGHEPGGSVGGAFDGVDSNSFMHNMNDEMAAASIMRIMYGVNMECLMNHRM